MNFEYVRIYNDGVELDSVCEKKVDKIVVAIKTLSKSAEVAFRFLKNGNLYEVLLWGKADDTPIGIYSSGPSMSHILDRIYGKAQKDCLKNKEMRSQARQRSRNHHSAHASEAMAG